MLPVISTIEIQQLASGDRTYLQVYKFQGQTPGKKAYLQANLHGAEIVGNVVIHQLIEYLSNLDTTDITGEIWLVPTCNPLGTNQRNHFYSSGRYNPYDGKDWNRIFWDYEKELPPEELVEFALTQLYVKYPEQIRSLYLHKQKQAFLKQLQQIQKPSGVPYYQYYRYQLQSLCLDANYVIDIHSSTNQSINYLYGFHDREESARYFLLDYGIILNEYDGDAFDEAFLKPWLALEKALASQGKKVRFNVESWTLELGSGMTINPDSVKIGVEGICNYLAYCGIIKYTKELKNKDIKLFEKKRMRKYYAPVGGMIQNRAGLQKKVKAGDKLYEIVSFNKTGAMPEVVEIAAQTNSMVWEVSTNEGVNQGEGVLTVLDDE